MPGLARTITRRDIAVDLRRPVAVEPIGKFRTRRRFHVDERRERHGITLAVADTEEADVIGLRTKIAFGFNIHLPHAAEAVKVIDEESTHERLQRLIYRIQV